MTQQEVMLVSLMLVLLALLIIILTFTIAIWDNRKNRPRAEGGIEELSSRIVILPDFAQSEYETVLSDCEALYEQKRYRECIRRTGRAREDLSQLMEVVRQGRAELCSIESKVEEARARGLVVDRAAIGLDGVTKFWGNGE